MKWITHQQNILIFGMQGTGKTTIVRNILDTIQSTPRLIISPQRPRELYGKYGNEINSVKELVAGGAFIWVGVKPDENLMNQICKKIMTFSNFVLIVDDAHEFCAKQKMPNEWKTLINSGRNRGVTSIFISPSPNLLHNVIIQSSQHLISFRFALESQIEYAKKNFFGDLAYLLLFRPARPFKFQKFSQLDKHDYLHRFIEDDFVSLNHNGEITQLHSIDDMSKDVTESDEETADNVDNLDQIKTNNAKDKIEETEAETKKETVADDEEIKKDD